jgi:hypothetical protein
LIALISRSTPSPGWMSSFTPFKASFALRF